MTRWKWVGLFSVIAAAHLIQTSIVPTHVIPEFRPDLLIVLMVYIALRLPFHTGAPLSWFLGIIKDVFSGLYLGLNAFSFLIIFLLIKSVSDRLYAENSFLFVITVGGATLASFSISLILMLMFTSTPGILYVMLSGLLPHLLVNLFAASLVSLLPVFSPQSPETT